MVCRVLVFVVRAAVDVSVHRLHMNSRYGDFGPLTIRFGLGGKKRREGGTNLVFGGWICRLQARGQGVAGRSQRKGKIDPAVSFENLRGAQDLFIVVVLSH